LENWVQIITPTTQSYITYDGNNGQYGVQTDTFQRFLTANNGVSGLGNNYNLPGGAHGSLLTNAFSLAGYSAGDAPTLYYNYMLQTEDANSITLTRDTARVYATADGGQTWFELTTNNDILTTNVQPAELPTYITPNAAANRTDPAALSTVQPTFDANTWLQARVDLSQFAGRSNIQLRFDFSTSGTSIVETGSGLGKGWRDEFNRSNDIRTAQNNNFTGLFIDDIIVGFANPDKWSPSTALPNTQFFALPQIRCSGARNSRCRAPTNWKFARARLRQHDQRPVRRHHHQQQFNDNQRLVNGYLPGRQPDCRRRVVHDLGRRQVCHVRVCSERHGAAPTSSSSPLRPLFGVQSSSATLSMQRCREEVQRGASRRPIQRVVSAGVPDSDATSTINAGFRRMCQPPASP
jgi:hypothetical protein